MRWAFAEADERWRKLTEEKLGHRRPFFSPIYLNSWYFFEKKPIGLVGFAGNQTGIAKNLLEAACSCVGTYLASLSVPEEISSFS